MADTDDLTPWLKNFTPRAKHVLALAQKESERLNHDYVGTEHLLLGLISLGEGVAVSVLRSMDSTSTPCVLKLNASSEPEDRPNRTARLR